MRSGFRLPSRFNSPALALRFPLCNTDHSATMVRYYLVKGRVQGVGFRWFVHREAAALGLRGWVRNTESGHVEVVAVGEASELKRLQALLAKGSRGSRVDVIEQRDLDPSEGEGLGPFEIEGAW
jgi:acylphosphatase